MELLVFSAGRAKLDLQHTVDALLRGGAVASVVVQEAQKALYKAALPGVRLVVLPKSVTPTLPAARAWVAAQARKRKDDKKVLMLDDDLSFAVRRKDDPTKFKNAAPADIQRMLTAIDKALDKYAHVGLCSREGGNRVTTNQEATRMSRVLAYNFATVPADVQFDRVLLPEDFDVTLQMLYRGLPNLVLAGWCHNQPGSNTAGGCSEYRTIAVHNEAMQHFGTLHPQVVKIVEKQTKTSWGGQARLDAHVQWKKALAMGRDKSCPF